MDTLSNKTPNMTQTILLSDVSANEVTEIIVKLIDSTQCHHYTYDPGSRTCAGSNNSGEHALFG